jgi:hypothetical protein
MSKKCLKMSYDGIAMKAMTHSPKRLEYVDGGFAPRHEILYLFYWKKASSGSHQSFAFLQVFNDTFWGVLIITAIALSLYLGFIIMIQNNIWNSYSLCSSLAGAFTVTLRAFSTIGFSLEAQR